MGRGRPSFWTYPRKAIAKTKEPALWPQRQNRRAQTPGGSGLPLSTESARVCIVRLYFTDRSGRCEHGPCGLRSSGTETGLRRRQGAHYWREDFYRQFVACHGKVGLGEKDVSAEFAEPRKTFLWLRAEI